MKKIQQVLFIILFTISLILTFDCKADTIVWSGSIELNIDQYFTQQQTLKIMPGTVVTATGSFKIEIQGNIIAEGTTDNPILFTVLDTLGLYDSATITGGWHGIHLLDNDNGQARFTHCRFEYGKANIPGSWSDQGEHDYLIGNQGGALWIVGYNNIELNNCTFYYNYARSRGGGIYYQDLDSISIIDCIFENNKVLVYGGGLFCDGQQYLIVDKCTFKLNSAWLRTIGGGDFGRGSAIYLDYPANPFNLITNNYFFNNKSLFTVSIGNSASFVYNNVFTNNYNWDVLTFHCDKSSHLVVNNIFANNFYESGIPGVFNFSQDLRFYNNILWNNFSDEYNDDDMALTSYNYPPADVQHCLVWEGRIDGTNIITDAPLFVDPAPNYGLESNGWEYDWTLRDESPAVNTGTPDTAGLNLPYYDLDGNPRVFGNRIDMGAYENQHIYVKIDNAPISEEIKLYPNPGTSNLYIQIVPEMKDCFFDLYNGKGNIIMHHQIDDVNSVFSTEIVPSGVYHYRIYDNNKVLKNSTWIKL